MFAQIASRALRAPALRASPANLQTLLATTWSRGLASNSRRGNSKKPSNITNPSSSPSWKPSSIGPNRGVAPAATRPSNAQSSQSVGAQADAKSTTPNTGKPTQSSSTGEDTTLSWAQEEARTESSGEVNSTQRQPSKPQPLPDLTQGIPSTWEFEASAAREAAGSSGLNLTEDPNRAGSGRGKGELPASAYVSSGEKRRLRVANYLYLATLAAIVGGYIYLGRNWDDEEEEVKHLPEAPSGWALGLMWNRAKARMTGQINYYNEPAFAKLLPDVDPSFERPYTLVLSLEDLLIHSEWTREHGWRMAKRPGVDYFLRYLSQYYELVIFTTVPWATGDPVIKKLDPYHIVMWPLFREATFYKDGQYVKDLSYLNRDMSKVILIDTVEHHAKAQPENAIILPKWDGNATDKELVSLIPFLEYLPTMAVPDVRPSLASFKGTHIPTEFAAREAVARKRFQEQLAAERAKRPHGSPLGFLTSALGVKPMMQIEGEQSPAEAFAKGKMLQDVARERGQKNYEALEKMIREEGEKWLAEEKAAEKKAQEEGMKQMTGMFTAGLLSGGEKKE